MDNHLPWPRDQKTAWIQKLMVGPMLENLPDQEDFCPITRFVTKSKIKVRILIFILRGKNKIENIFIPQDWTVVRDPQKRMGPYAYKNSEWVSFDDIDTIGQKIEILKDYKLGGAMIWALGKILILLTKKIRGQRGIF